MILTAATPFNHDFDPGNLVHRIDASHRSYVRTSHAALDGRDHMTPETLDALEADPILAERETRS